ncbi:MAG: hypothetical protein KBD83_05145 [Gammaproteobacteria bacterium]|nr:hypothetical protein [Gammaproteobacteria bacterium]
MKYPKQFFALLLASLLASSISQAATSKEIRPNQVPQSVKFYLSQPEGKIVTLTFQNSALPAKFLCYFDTSPQTKGIRASITSDNNILDFSSDGSSNIMEAGKSKPAMFTVASATGNQRKGSVTFTLDMSGSKFRGNSISMTCTMSK